MESSKESAVRPKTAKTVLSHASYGILKKKLSRQALQQLKQALTVTPQGHSEYPNPLPFPVYTETHEWMYIPRWYGLVNYGEPDETRLCRVPLSHACSFAGSLRGDPQRVPHDITLNYLREKKSGLLSLPTGTGKTVIALSLVAQLQQKTCILVHTSQLLTQWQSEIRQFLPTLNIGVVQQKKKVFDPACDIYLVMIQTLVNIDSANVPGNVVGFTIVDECLPYHQKIWTERGALPIGYIYNMWKQNKPLPLVYSFNEETKSFELKCVTYAWKKENVDTVLKISYEKGCFECTRNHKILTDKDGWIEASQLKIGDLLLGQYDNNISAFATLRVLDIKSVSNSNYKNKHRNGCAFDISVTDNHNFITVGSGPNRSGVTGVIVHNCHHISSQTFSQVLYKVNATYLLGLSATPTRKDGLTRVLHWHLGELIYAGKPDRSHQLPTVIQIHRFHDTEYQLNPRRYAEMMTLLTQSESRNRFLINTLKRVVIEPDVPQFVRRTLILTERVRHATWLQQELEKLLAEFSLHCGLVLSGMKKHDLEVEKSKYMLVSTYQLFSEGISVDTLNAICFATPKKDIVQSMGRIYRGKVHPVPPLILDISDSVLRGQERARVATYKNELKKHCTITTIEPSFD